MRSIDTWLDAYGESHKNPTNKLVHWVCVPFIFFSIVGFFWEIKLPIELPIAGGIPLNGAMIAMIVVFFYYVFLSLPIAAGMLVFAAACLLGQYGIEQTGAPVWLVSAIIFIVAWIGQFIGHNIEGKKPSFLKDIQFLMIGPAWLMSFIFQKAGIKY